MGMAIEKMGFDGIILLFLFLEHNQWFLFSSLLDPDAFSLSKA